MNTIRFYNPWVERSLISDLFDSMSINDMHEKRNCGCVPANVVENDNDFRIELAIPGFTKEEVKINIEKNILTIRSVKNEEEGKKENYVSREFGTRNFERKFILSKNVNAELISAGFNNGILEILLPKKEEVTEKSPLEIAIQ